MHSAPRAPALLLAALLAASCADRPPTRPDLELPALDTPSSEPVEPATDASARGATVLFGIFEVDGTSGSARPSGAPIVSAADVAEARSMQTAEGTIVLRVQLDAAGTARLAKATRENQAKRLAVVVNDVVTSLFEVEDEIRSGVVSAPVSAKDREGQRAEADHLVKAISDRKRPAKP